MKGAAPAEEEEEEEKEEEAAEAAEAVAAGRGPRRSGVYSAFSVWIWFCVSSKKGSAYTSPDCRPERGADFYRRRSLSVPAVDRRTDAGERGRRPLRRRVPNSGGRAAQLWGRA